MADIKPISSNISVPDVQGTVNAELVEDLTNLLEMAKAGLVVGVAYVINRPGGYTAYQCVGRFGRGGLGALVCLQHMIARRDLNEDGEG